MYQNKGSWPPQLKKDIKVEHNLTSQRFPNLTLSKNYVNPVHSCTLEIALESVGKSVAFLQHIESLQPSLPQRYGRMCLRDQYSVGQGHSFTCLYPFFKLVLEQCQLYCHPIDTISWAKGQIAKTKSKNPPLRFAISISYNITSYPKQVKRSEVHYETGPSTNISSKQAYKLGQFLKL